MFSTHAATPITRRGDAQLRNRLHRPDHRGRAAHVVLHLLHALRRLDADAAGVKGDAFADQHQRRLFMTGRRVFEHNQLRFVGAAAADRQQDVHVERVHFASSPRTVHCRPASAGHRLRAPRHRDGIEHIRRFVGEVTRQVDARGDLFAAPHTRLDARQAVGVEFDDGQSAGHFRAPRACSWARDSRQQRAFRQPARRRRHPAHRSPPHERWWRSA
jgi:hypothetical protein